jgi:hypothetical protein
MAWCLVKAQGQLYLSPLPLPKLNDVNVKVQENQDESELNGTHWLMVCANDVKL